MWFRKQSHPGGGNDNARAGHASDGYLITEDLLVRGTVSMRRGRPIRQIGVTVQGSTVMVTTGDTVDQEVYDALVALGALAGCEPPAATHMGVAGDAVSFHEDPESR